MILSTLVRGQGSTAPLCSNTIGGTVFNDINNNGIFNTADSLGFSGIKVYAFNCAGVKIDSAVTDSRGRYTLTRVTSADDTVRIEFLASSFPYWAKPTYNGTDGRTDVQFVKAPNCSVDMGLTNSYCQSSPQLITGCYVNGAINTTTPVGVLVQLNYDGSNKVEISHKVDIGATWGLAYNQTQQLIYASAFLKRHVGLRENSGAANPLGAIYQVNPGNTANGSLFFDLSTIDNAIGTVATNAARGLGVPTAPSADPTVYDQIAKIGIGDIDISEDNQYLYAMSLGSRKLWKLSTTSPAASAVSWDVPNPNCGGSGTYRPFAVKVYRGEVYIGIICDGQGDATNANMKATVYKINPDNASNTFSQVISYPLTYARNDIAGGVTGCGTAIKATWQPWTATFPAPCGSVTGADVVRYPQPVLSDIEFDADGSMVMGFLDRFSHQSGNANYNLAGTGSFDGIAAGDILRAAFTNGTYVLENNGKVGNLTAAETRNNPQGPGGLEFYNDNFYSDFAGNVVPHHETGSGGLALVPVMGEVAQTAYDPINGGTVETGGITFLSNTNGAKRAGVYIYQSSDPSTFGKAGGLSDLEALCNPLPIQIGNRLWIDTDRDGVQDPCNEPAIPNMVVSLYDKLGNFIAKDTTNAVGEYYFDASNVSGGLQPNTQYYIVIGKETYGTGAQFDNVTGTITQNGTKYQLTAANSTTNSGNDQNDSDFEIAGATLPAALQGFPVFCATTPSSGSDHTSDAGFSPPCIKPNAGTNQSICAPTTTATLTAITSGGTWSAQSGNPALATITNAGAVSGMTANGTYNFIYLLNGCTDTVSVTRNLKPNAGANQSICAPTTTVTLTAITSGGTWSAQSGNPALATITNAGAVSGMIVNGTYNFIYTLNGCTDTVSVIRNPQPIQVNLSPAVICENQSLTYNDPSGTNGTWSGPGVTDNGSGASLSGAAALTQLGQSAPVSFYIYYTQTLGECSRIDSGLVSINPRPLVSITGPTLVCGNKLPVSFTGSPAGGTFSLPQGLPAGAVTINNNVATLNAGFNITSLTFSYQFTNVTGCSNTDSHTITVTPAPNAGPDQTLACVNPVTNTLQTTTTLTGAPSGGTWSAQSGNPAAATVTNAGAVTGMTVAGSYRFIYTLNDCSDTVAVTVSPCQGCVKPNAGNDQSICSPTTTANLTAITSGGTWSAQSGNPALATITSAGAVSGMTADGTYRFIYSVTSGGETCTDTVSVIRNLKPNAGANQTLTCPPSGISPTTAALTGTPSGGVWSTLASNPAAATVTNAGAVSGMTVAGTYSFIYTLNDCADTIQVQVPVCIIPIFDLALRKTLATGQSASVVAGSNVTFTITVFNQGNVDATNIQLSDYIPTGLTLNDANWTVTGTTATLVSPIASLAAGASTTRNITFTVGSGVTGSITNLAEISAATGGTDVDSNPDSNSGNDGTPKNDVINENGLTGGDQDDHDPEVITVTPAPVFDLALRKTLATGQSASVVAGSNVTFTITVFNQGNVDATNIQLSDYIPTGLTLNDANWSSAAGIATLNTPIASLAAGASTTRNITFTVGSGVTGSITNLAEISAATGGTDVDSNPDSNSGNDGTPKNDVINENGLTGGDQDDHDPEVITVTPPAQVDLALKKMISTKIAQLGDTLTYTIKVFNQSATLATGVEVSDSLATSVQFINGSFTSTRGTATITNNVIVWNIGNIAANGDTVTLNYKVKVTQEGVHFNTAEITKTNEGDIDSTPGNGDEGEDDIDRQCFTVPLKLCPGEKVQVSIPAQYTNVQWFKEGSTTAIASGNIVLLVEAGTYTFTATNKQCPAEGCCPIIISPGANCCPVDICIPFTIKQTKKAGKAL